MKNRIFILILCLSATMSSCALPPRKMVAVSTIKLEGKNVNIRDLIEIDGYYESDSTSFRKWLFYDDGTYGPVSFKEGSLRDSIQKNMSKWIWSTFDKDKNDWKSYFYPGWGVYRIDKDTIVIQDVAKAGIFSQPWSFHETKYEVLDRKTLKWIYWKTLYPTDKQDMKKDPYEISKKNFIYQFISADSLPPSDNWLKEEKWIWRNEQDWKAYMDKIKKKK